MISFFFVIIILTINLCDVLTLITDNGSSRITGALPVFSNTENLIKNQLSIVFDTLKPWRKRLK